LYDPPRVLDPDAHLGLLDAALREDAAERDLTTEALVPADARGTAEVVCRERGVLAGLPLLPPLLRRLDPTGTVEALAQDGEEAGPGAVVARLRARSRALLAVERTALNVLRRLSGVATLTARYVEAVAGTGAKVYDTRKTTPGWRELEKHAVRCGGGENHRMRLDDAAMLKENHLLASEGTTGPAAVGRAVARLRETLPEGVPLCVEVESVEELEAALPHRPDVVMLDGFDLGDVRRAVRLVRASGEPRPLVEATGGITLENVAAFAAAGVDRVSVGALTHSAPALDLSMRFLPA
jgi:nicotinate-nucleotide pyrophosphorylase (carboxylating)